MSANEAMADQLSEMMKVMTTIAAEQNKVSARRDLISGAQDKINSDFIQCNPRASVNQQKEKRV